MLIACLGMVLTHTTLMIRTKITKLHLSPISLHSASSVRIPSSVNNFREKVEKRVEKVIEQKIKEKTQELADRVESLDFEKNELADR